jgi:putative ABC transport system ATP-binding protein
MRVSLRKLKKSYAGNPVIDIGLSEFEPGSHTVIMGDSGAGKSTLLNLIAGITKPDSGTILLGDTDVAGLKEHQRDRFRSKNVGYVFQNFNLLPELTVMENIQMAGYFSGYSVSGADLQKLLGEVGMQHKAGDYPATLSMGQRQRIAVVRAIATHPGLILADEPTGSLDRNNKETVINLLRKLTREIDSTLILVTHDSWVSEQFETIIPLESINRAVSP